MAETLQAVRGMNDILPHQTFSWRHLETLFSTCLTQYGYQEIRFPLMERTALFKRSIGEVTDIVEKEMYTFTDLNGESLTLRPEGTASCVRACLEHGLLQRQQQKLWYSGPMFRHEKPQKGRYRQFHHLGVEVFGLEGVGIELELLLLCRQLLTQFGLVEGVHLQINTLGEMHERQQYRAVLIDYFEAHRDALDADSVQRLHRSPLRILDSKNPAMQTLIQQAPKLFDVLGEHSKSHFEALCRGLDALNIAYTIDPCLVRGLDYYEHTVFEWVTEHLGSQATVCAGGRYDQLVSHLGGPKTPAVGFAMGAERLLLLMEAQATQTASPPPDAMFLALGEAALVRALTLADALRDALGWRVLVNTSGARFKRQFKEADQSGARFALILGEEEMNTHVIGIKSLRHHEAQITLAQDDLIAYLKGDMHVNLHD